MRRGTELADLLTTISLGVKRLSRLVATSDLPQRRDYGFGEELTLDQQADSILVDLLGDSGHLGLLVSESRDSVVATAVAQVESEFVVALDPLDGVSNLGSNIPVGTCFAILRKKEAERQAVLDDFLQTGRNIVAAGYAIYGSKTAFVFSVGNGVLSFTLDTALGEFILTDGDLKVPQTGPWYSVNEGYSQFWNDETLAYVDYLKMQRDGDRPGYRGRYIGSLVADFDRTLRHGGVYMHPVSECWPQGKLHLLYECMPLAFLIEQAGGVASTGTGAVLDARPKNIHDRCPLVLGSPREMALFHKMVGNPQQPVAQQH